MYADKEYYLNAFNDGGEASLPDEKCTKYLRRASAFLDSLFIKSKPQEPYDENIKNACCEIADYMFSSDSRAGIASESNDGYSVTYSDEITQERISAQCYVIAARYLGHTGLLYRGIG